MIQACQARGSASITGLHSSLELQASQLASLHYRDTLTMVASVGASMDNDNSIRGVFMLQMSTLPLREPCRWSVKN